jgi:hypothetical protein
LRFVREEVKRNVGTLEGWNVNTSGKHEKEKKGTMYRAPTKKGFGFWAAGESARLARL